MTLIKLKQLTQATILLIVLVVFNGCSSIQKIFSPSSSMDTVIQTMDSPVSTCSPMLGWLGGVCALGGMALLVLTGGRIGWRPVIGGIIFIIINYALAMYASWFFLPVVIATGAISLAWAGKIVYRIVNDNDIKLKEILK